MTLRARIVHEFGGFGLDVDLRIERPGVTALFGPSGAGKSSVLKAVAGLVRPDRADIRWNEDILADSTAGVFVPAHKRRFAMVFQEARLLPHLSVERNLRFGWRRTGRDIAEGEIARLIDILDLKALLDRRPVSLSGGERQRVAIGRALLSRPRLLLLDEPVSALDGARRGETLALLERLRDEEATPMLYVSHTIDEVARLADRIVLLDKGRVAASGPADEILSRLDLLALTGREAPGALVLGRVMDNNPATGLTRVAFEGGELAVPLIARPAGSAVRLRIPARDVLIAADPLPAISANNVLPALIGDISPHGAYESDLRLHLGKTTLLARVTAGSVTRLGLAPGRQVFAVIKSVTIARA